MDNSKTHQDLVALTKTWRLSLLEIAAAPQPSAGDVLQKVAKKVQREHQQFCAMHADDKTVVRLASDKMNIALDGCARLYADWREGIGADAMRTRITEEQHIWFTQLFLR